MAICIECQEEYSDKRKKIGYDTCLECGDFEATKEIVRKSTCIAPAYNKGPYMFVTSSAMAKDVGK